MDFHPVVWGLDIGHTSIKAVKLARTGDSVSVLGYSIEPIPSGENVDRDTAVVSALQSLSQREELGSTPVITALSGRQIFARTINIPLINEKKLDKMVELEARQQIPGNFDEVRWGYHKSPSIDQSSYDVALFAVRNEIIDDLVGKAKQVGLNLVGISVTSLAIYNYVQYDQDFSNDETVIILDVGAENTDLVVYRGESMWMRNLGVSGSDITRAFQKKFRVSFEEAEQLKCQVAESRQAEKIFKVIEGSLGELVSDVQRSLGFYKSSNPDTTFESMVVSGNTFRLPNLNQYIADRLGYAIITLVETERIKINPGLDRDHFLEDLQSLGAAVGLGLQGVGYGKANVNLLPSSLRIQSILRAKRWAAVAVLLILPLAFIINYQIEKSYLEANWGLIQRIHRGVQENQRNEAASLAIIERIPAITREAMGYANYAAHIGTLQAVEQGIFRMIQDLVQSEMELPWAESNVVEGGHPHLAPVYFHSLEIPNQTPSGVDAFQPLARPRQVVVAFRVPDGINQLEMNQRILQRLSDLRVTPTMWRAAHPGTGAAMPATDELPRLFGNVMGLHIRREPDHYFFMDPLRRDPATGEPAPEAERVQRRDVLTHTLTFRCDLAPIAELPALGGG
ncbi:MAG: type IV pilus assembly protein PilM [Planctomycetota bacterium]|nr:MAG: type IV pilus assembly protein PilM [Planctomycetota bacterium]